MHRIMISIGIVFALASSAVADPLALTDKQMDKVTAGFTVNPSGTSSIGIALFNGGTGETTIVAGGQNRVLPTTAPGTSVWSGHLNGNGDILTNP